MSNDTTRDEYTGDDPYWNVVQQPDGSYQIEDSTPFWMPLCGFLFIFFCVIAVIKHVIGFTPED